MRPNPEAVARQAADRLPVRLITDIDGVWRADDTAPAVADAAAAKRFSSVIVPPTHNGWPTSVVFDPTLIARLTALSRDGLVEVTWVTSWRDRAAKFAEAVGADDWPSTWPDDFEQRTHQHLGDLGWSPSERRPWWKATEVRQLLAGDPPTRRWLWLDDELDDAVRDELRDLAAGDRGRMVAPDWLLGVTPELMDQIEAWVRTEDGA